LANFLPAVLLQPGDWTLRAEVLWGRKRKLRKQLELSNETGLVSHYRDTGTWTSRTETWFLERFETVDTDWTVHPGEAIDLGNQSVVVPDLTFKNGNRVGHLEICGFWRVNHLAERLEQLPDNVILAVSSKLKGEKGTLSSALEAKVIRFAEVIPPAKVIERLEQVAR
jgi:predicted nuclease of restriction endonuclease-like RecB superfamily